MRRMILALVFIAASVPALGTELFTIRTFALPGLAGGCTAYFYLENNSGRTVETFSATLSTHDSRGTSLGTRLLRFEYVDNGGAGKDTLEFPERCEVIPALKLRAVDRCVISGQRLGDCLGATGVQGSIGMPWPVTFTR